MGKAEIIQHLKDGQYTVRLLFNDEYILFQTHRLEERQRELNAEIANAEAELATAEENEQQSRAALDEAIKKLNGQVSEEAKAKGSEARTAASAAVTAADDASSALANAFIQLDAAQNALPPEPPPSAELLAQFAHASALYGEAVTAVNDAREALQTFDAACASLVSALGASAPDLAALAEQVSTAVTLGETASTPISEATTALNSASTALSAIDLPPGATESATLLDSSGQNLDTAEEKLGDATEHRAQAVGALQALMSLLTPGGPEARKKVQEALAVAQHDQVDVDSWTAWLTDLEEAWNRAAADLADLANVPRDETRVCWCVDLTENLRPGRIVATLDIPGEMAQYSDVVIAAGSLKGRETEVEWNYQRDGWFTPIQALSPQAWFYNLAMLPGWQIFRPTFRCGRITAIHADKTATVFLTEPLDSSQRGIRVYPRTTSDSPPDLATVKMKYMDCDSAAFAVGDEVIIRFIDQDAHTPEIIGFRDHPKPCAGLGFLFPEGHIRGEPGQWRYQTYAQGHYGMVDWRGRQSTLSFAGPVDRYWTRVAGSFAGVSMGVFGRTLYRANQKLAEVSEDEWITGAAVQADGASARVALVVTTANWRTSEEWLYRGSAVGTGLATLTALGPIPPAPGYYGIGSRIDPEAPTLTSVPLHPWLFNREGTEARSLRERIDGRLGVVALSIAGDLITTEVLEDSSVQTIAETSGGITTRTTTGVEPVAVDYAADRESWIVLRARYESSYLLRIVGGQIVEESSDHRGFLQWPNAPEEQGLSRTARRTRRADTRYDYEAQLDAVRLFGLDLRAGNAHGRLRQESTEAGLLIGVQPVPGAVTVSTTQTFSHTAVPDPLGTITSTAMPQYLLVIGVGGYANGTRTAPEWWAPVQGSWVYDTAGRLCMSMLLLNREALLPAIADQLNAEDYTGLPFANYLEGGNLAEIRGMADQFMWPIGWGG